MMLHHSSHGILEELKQHVVEMGGNVYHRYNCLVSCGRKMDLSEINNYVQYVHVKEVL